MSARIISVFFFRTRTSLPSSSRTSSPFDRFNHICSVIIMPYQQRRGGFKEEQKWREKPNVSSHASGSSPEASSGVDAVTNRLASMSIATPPLQFGTVGVASHQKGVWRPKSYATVSEPAATPAAVTVKAPGAVDLNNLLDNFTVNDSTYSLAQIRATFYPKFENEKSDQEVRTRMIEMVSKGLATLEVSLKHSGSLFMYAGHQGGAYAKNSYGNIYTAVGVFVLGRTFREAWGIAASQKQAEFSDFLESNRMCISMELVTAVLGDHGQRPRDDYVVVTAVTELGNGKPKFYSTPDIIAFCRKWRLPTNHVWLFSTRKSVASFFASFDALCEEGTASTVCKALNEVADISVPGTKDHIKVQGEILEGLVARIVSHASSKHMDQVLHDFPPPPSEGDGLDLGPSLREICAANRSNEKQQMKALLEAVGTAFCPDDLDWFGKERTDSHYRLADRSFLSKFLQTRPADFSTTKFQEMVRLMRDRRHRAAFKCYPNFHKIGSVSSDNLHFKMVIHVHSDSVFRQYQKEMRTNPGLWPLYRGFFVDLNLFKVNKEKAAEMANNNPFLVENGNNHNRAQGVDGLADEDANLMIKLKFLTYKLRTFLIRNGLSILFKQGPSAYKTYYQRQMKIWNTSPEKQRQLSKMLDEWAVYIRRKYGNKQLSSSTYLSEAEPFLEQYARRSPENQALIGSAGNFVHAEDFMAIVDGGRDEEGDLETEKEAEPSSPCLPSKDVITKDDGLIVFFPGIPGCAKSALCKELLNTPGVFGDGRPVHSLMGDLIKGKYWDKVNEQHRRKPKSIMLADKNAPNEEVWSRIEEMCRRTKSYAVPVVPDSEGSDSNPFSIDALAVFMFRVLQRVNHPGNLDKNSKNPGYVLLMFYDLYDGKSREEFERELIDRFGSLVKMPLLKPDRAPLPDRVKLIIEEGMDLYKLHQRRHGRSEPTKGSYAAEWAKWEKRLAETLSSEANYLNSIQVPFQDAVSQVVGQLKAIASGSYKAPSPSSSAEKRNFATIVFAAVSLPVNEIQTLLDDLARKHPKIKSFLAGKNLETKLEKAHVTLAHKRSHGVTAVANYGVFLNQPVPVQVTALLFSDNMAAALETRLGSVDGEQVISKNPWPHVTLWTADGVGAKEANRLPELFAQGKAVRVEIVPPKAITGVLRFY